MYQAHAALFLYATSPVHMGASQAFGLIDNPIARERHTDHPVLAGSGLKGALRHRFEAEGGSWTDGGSGAGLLQRLFGDSTDKARHAGAISIGDANLVSFPVRSLRRGFVHATSAHALARMARCLKQVGVVDVPEDLPAPVAPGSAVVTHDKLTHGGRLHLEAYEFETEGADATQVAQLKAFADWLAQRALPATQAMSYFREKMAHDLVLLADEDLTWFARNATSVEPHVRINAKTGAADDGGLFFTENLPVESLMLAPLMATPERSDSAGAIDATAVLAHVAGAIHDRWIQVGGDATTGRGLMAATVLSQG
jgi:CRISPR-associated protein Cmr4